MRLGRWLLVILLLVPAAAGADAPGAPGEGERAESTFVHFAAKWMDRMRDRGDRVGDDYTIELRATGYTTSPFVGLLRYTALENGSTVPITEIFRYENGRWVY